MVRPTQIRKRDGRIVDFDENKIWNAIWKAAQAVGGKDRELARKLARQVVELLDQRLKPGEIPTVEQVQDLVEKVLVENGHYKTAKAYILYRRERTWIREEKKRLLEKEVVDEVDKAFSVNAIRVLASRYLLRDEEGKLVESPKQMFQRVAALITIPDILHDPRIFDKEARQQPKPGEEFDARQWEGKLGVGDYKFNRWHLERMKALYDELNLQGRMKVSWKGFLKLLEQGEFEIYYQNFLDYYRLMVEKKFLPNSPTLFNAGARLSQLSACFVIRIDDDLESIMQAAKNCALIFQSGGGIGINYSKLRPEGDLVASTSGVASGPISFMKIIDTVTDVVKQGGCIASNSLVRTTEGIIPLSSFRIFNPRDETPLLYSIYDGKCFTPVTSSAPNGGSEVIRIKTELGNYVDVTYNELVATLDEKGEIAFKEAYKLEEGDYVVVALGGVGGEEIDLPPIRNLHFNSNPVKVPKQMNVELAELLGFYMANGCWNRGRLLLSFNKHDRIDEWCKKINRVFNLLPGERRDRKSWIDVVWFSRELEEYFEKQGWKKENSSKAFVPEAILRSSEKIIGAFLRGLFEGDGYVHEDGYPVLYTTSQQLAKEVQQALLALRIVARVGRIEKDARSWGKKSIYTIKIVDKRSVKNFLEKVGFLSEKKNEKVRKVLKKKYELAWRLPNQEKKLKQVLEELKLKDKQKARKLYRRVHKYLLGQRNLTLNALSRLAKEFPEITQKFEELLEGKYYFAKVVKKETRREDTFHLEVCSGRYVANGILLHNKRRGANMGILEIWHPDIEKFIAAKETPGMLENFNLSIAITPEFLDAYEKGKSFELINPRTGKVWKRVDARYLLDSIAMSAWKTGDPGVVFLDRINKRNVLLEAKGPIRSTNPCVTGDTLVATDQGLVRAKNLEKGMKVWTLEGYCEVEEVINNGIKPVVEVELSNGTRIKVTHDHQFLTSRGWRKVGELRSGDKVGFVASSEYGNDCQPELEFVSIQKIEEAGEEEVFDVKAPPAYAWVTNGVYSKDCGEEPLYEYESCNLGSINLYAHFKEDELGNKTFDWEGLRQTVKLATRFLDNVIDVNKFPLPEIEKNTKQTRKIGLGVMGLADMLYALKIPYNSEEGFKLMRNVMEFITYNAMLESSRLAEQRGVFPLFVQSSYPKGELPIEGFYQKKLWTQDWKGLVQRIKETGIRNAEVTTIAPTGSLSMIVDVSSGIEPQYALVFEKIITIGSFWYTDQEFERQLKLNGLFEEDLLKKVRENGGSIQGVEQIPEELRKVFVTALDIPWWDHVRAQAEIGLWVCAATSKTINMPNWVTPEDVKNAFLFAYKLGCKGVTIFRDGCKGRQVLYVPVQQVRNRQREVMKLVKNETPKLLRRCGIKVGALEEETTTKTLKFVVSEAEEEKMERCPECKSVRLVEESGCIKCLDCGWSVCVVG